MPSLKHLKNLNGNPNAVEINSSFSVPASTEVYRTDKGYYPGDRVLYLNSTTNQYEVFKCTVQTTGAWNTLNWKLDNVDNEIMDSQFTQNKKRGELVRASTHSGIVDVGTFINSRALNTLEMGKGIVGTPNTAQYIDTVNRFKVTNFTAVIDGNVIEVANVGDVERVDVLLPPPPLTGTRDDFVFLEAWYQEVKTPEQQKSVEMKWRIRVVADVDFDKYPEGFDTRGTYINVKTSANHLITAQGALETPLPTTEIDSSGNQRFLFNNHNSRRQPWGKKAALGDVGVYVSGDGSQFSKDTLKTYDGFTYAVPMFRVKRRNTTPYSINNLNGAPICVNKHILLPVSSEVGVIKGPYECFTPNTSIPDVTGIKVGDLLQHYTIDKPSYEVASIDTTNKTLMLKGLLTGSGSAIFYIKSNRPDQKFADIIHRDDIIDLRHKISLTGFNYDKLLKENFDKYLRNELVTKRENVVEQYGLNPVQHNEASVLKPTIVPLANGSNLSLTNMLGTVGEMTDTVYFSPSYCSIFIDSTEKPLGLQRSLKLIGDPNSTYYYSQVLYKVPIDNTKHYIILADIKVGSSDEGFIQVGATGNISGATVNDKLSFKTAFVRIAPQHMVGLKHIVVKPTINRTNPAASNANLTGYVGALRVYEITKEEYDKINVDAEYTGTKLFEKYPYVSSYPTILENFAPARKLDKGYYDYHNSILQDSSSTVYRSFKTAIPAGMYIIDSPNSMSIVRTHVENGTSTLTSGNLPARFEVTENATICISLRHPASQTTPWPYSDDITEARIILRRVTTPELHVPPGRWYYPYTSLDNNLVIPTSMIQNDSRKTWSYAQNIEQNIDLIDPVATPQKHISVTQAVKGTWSVNDTIKIKSEAGVVLGPMDSDTNMTRIVSYPDGNYNHNLVTNAADKSKFKVESIDGFSVGDKLVLVQFNFNGFVQLGNSGVQLTITAIDTVNKIISTDQATASSVIHTFALVEATDASSSPIVRLGTNDGALSSSFTTITWSGLGTREITGTITSIPVNSNTGSMSVCYSVAYPSGRGFKYLPDEILDVKVNGQKYIKNVNKTLTFIADYANKVPGNVFINPHLSRVTSEETLFTPDKGNEVSETSYARMRSFDGTYASPSVTSAGRMPQQSFSFNLLDHVERLYGTIPGASISQKVIWLRSNITKITANWWGFGSNPTGNKAYFTVWANNAWQTPVTNSTMTSSRLVRMLSTVWDRENGIQSNGFVHFIAYTDASDGAVPSVISTDYIELQVELSTDIKLGLLSGDTTQSDDGYEIFIPENLGVKYTDNMVPMNQSYPIDATGLSNYPPEATSPIEITSPGWARTKGIAGITNRAMTLNTGPVKVSVTPGKRYEIVVKTRVTPGRDSAISAMYWDASNNLINFPGNALRFTPTGQNQVLSLVTTAPSNATKLYIDVAIYTAAENDEINFGGCVIREYDYNLLGQLTPGRKSKTISNFVGKVVGNTLSNPNRFCYLSLSNLSTSPANISNPSNELQQAHVNGIMSATNGLISTATASGNNYSSVYFDFDLSVYGFSINELRKAVTRIKFNWSGYGKGVLNDVETFGAVLERWDEGTSSWIVGNEMLGSSPATIIAAPNNGAITMDSRLIFRVRTKYPSKNSDILAAVYTNYVWLELDFAEYVDQVKQNVVKVRKSTKEMKLHFPRKSYINGQEDVVEITYSHTPIPEEISPAVTEKVTILAEMDNFFLSDLSSSVGFKQGVHHYQNPLYRLGVDTTQVFGEFGYSEVPVSADTRNVNVGSEVRISFNGLAGEFTRQYGLNVVKKNLVFSMAYLVMHNSELKILIISRYNDAGQTMVSATAHPDIYTIMVPIQGNPLVKDTVGTLRPLFNSITEWRTPSEQILGFVSGRNAVVGSPSTFPEANIWIEE